jgi:UDP-2-acetamido-2,6-beta-L-arabino-hexul-4-ose reductase
VRVLVTGGDGFLGWHTRVRLRAHTNHDVVVANRDCWSDLHRLAQGVDAVIHIAGVNRGSAVEVEQGNISLARDVSNAVRASGDRPTMVFANSIHAGADTPYGTGKAAAASLLSEVAREMGSAYVDVALPNLFGEHGRPHYNSFVATFVDAVVRGATPLVADRPVELLHVQRAAGSLLEAVDSGAPGRLHPAGTPTSVQEVFGMLRMFNDLYASGDIPPLSTDFDVALFNTLRAARFPACYPILLTPRADHRGSLVEVVRSHGGQGQTFVSTTKPGATRGEHFHLAKVERFVVLSGRGRISLRKMLTRETVSFDVDGVDPCIVDMPTMWAHNITNHGESELTTLFWTHELFDPNAADTFPEPVAGPVAMETSRAGR